MVKVINLILLSYLACGVTSNQNFGIIPLNETGSQNHNFALLINLFKRNVLSDFSKFTEILDVSGGDKAVTICSSLAYKKKTQSAPEDPYINAFHWDKTDGICKIGTIPYTKLGDLPQRQRSQDQDGVYVQQGCYLGGKYSWF